MGAVRRLRACRASRASIHAASGALHKYLPTHLSLYSDAMENRPKLYAITAFVAGILLTLGYKDFYPDLEWWFWRRRKANRTVAGAGLQDGGQINLEDHEKNGPATMDVPEGIEACIGNTPLFKIKSLSSETGCDILAKAEVRFRILLASSGLSDRLAVSQWRWRQSERQSSPRHHQSGKSKYSILSCRV